MRSSPKIPTATLESICRFLGALTTGNGITEHLKNCKIDDNSGQSTKWRRLYHIFNDLQNEYDCSNHLYRFIQSLLHPSNYVGRRDEFEEDIQHLNQDLMFFGLEYR